MRDYSGRLVADPLRKGGGFCMMHTVLFMVQPTNPDESIVAYIDLETNSLDVLSGNIVEIGALIGGTRGMFSTVVHPGNDETSEDASVHGIPRAELLLGPHFAEAFGRLEQFLQYACLSVLESDDDSEDGRLPPVAMKQNLEVTVVAHNGLKFDFPFLLQECIRAGLGPSAMAGWVYGNNATREKLGNERAKLFMANGVFKGYVLRIYASHLDETQERPSRGIKSSCVRSS
jgi:DNA polymerase III epsilon subunit-like protein